MQRWAQCELKLAPGREPWIIVRHRKGWFRVPWDVPLHEVLQGVGEGWTATKSTRRSPTTVRITLDEYRRLSQGADTL